MRVWLRADASSSMGLGHVMRLLAVAERARNAALDPHFVVGCEPTMLTVIASWGFGASLVGADEQAWLESVGTSDLVVFDGYHFDADLLRQAGRRAARVAAVDDFGSGEFPVDVLLNQNPVANPGYGLPKGSVSLLGPRYALVREEFLRHRRERGDDPPRVLLVTMGGSDVAALSRVAVDAAASRVGFDRVLVVVGPAAELVTEDLPPDIDIVRAPSNVADTFASADAAISAAGSTTWELLAMGLPTALVEVTGNQRHVGSGVAREGAGIFLGGTEDFAAGFADATRRLANRDERHRLSARALQLVDGLGADRFLAALRRGEISPRQSQ